MFSLFRNVKFI